MILYVETNFLLEIVREQEERPYAEMLLGLAESGASLRLYCPAHSISEAVSNAGFQRVGRQRVLNEMLAVKSQFIRSPDKRELVGMLGSIEEHLSRISRVEEEAVINLTRRMLRITTPLSITDQNHRLATELVEGNSNLRFADALVFAAILEHARAHPLEQKGFVSRDHAAFGKTLEADSWLKQYNGKYLPSFKSAAGYIEFTLTRGESQP